MTSENTDSAKPTVCNTSPMLSDSDAARREAATEANGQQLFAFADPIAAKPKLVFGKEIKNPGKKSPCEISDSKFELAAFQSFGNIAAIARLLEVNYSTLISYLRDPKHSGRLAVVHQAKQQLVDDAEAYVRTCLANDDVDDRIKVDLAKFILKTQGKEAGWSESPQIANSINISSENIDLKTIFGITDS